MEFLPDCVMRGTVPFAAFLNLCDAFPFLARNRTDQKNRCVLVREKV